MTLFALDQFWCRFLTEDMHMVRIENTIERIRSFIVISDFFFFENSLKITNEARRPTLLSLLS
jgi:hypothetical protein